MVQPPLSIFLTKVQNDIPVEGRELLEVRRSGEAGDPADSLKRLKEHSWLILLEEPSPCGRRRGSQR